MEPNPTFSPPPISITSRHSAKKHHPVWQQLAPFQRASVEKLRNEQHGTASRWSCHCGETQLSIPLPSLGTDDISLRGWPCSSFPSPNFSLRNIPATRNQNYRAPSPTRQPTLPLKWKLKPRALSLCKYSADKHRQPRLLEAGKGAREAIRSWHLSRLSTWSLLLAYLSTGRIWGSAGMFAKGSGCSLEVWQMETGSFFSGSDWEMQMPSEQMSLCLCCCGQGPLWLLLIPCSPNCRRTKHNKWFKDWCHHPLFFFNLILAVAAWYKACF